MDIAQAIANTLWFVAGGVLGFIGGLIFLALRVAKAQRKFCDGLDQALAGAKQTLDRSRNR